MWTTLESFMVDVEGFQDVFVRMWQHLNTSQLITFSMTTWSLWRKRNLKLYEDKTDTMSTSWVERKELSMHGIMQDILTLMIEPTTSYATCVLATLLLQIISSVTLMHHFLQLKKR